MKISVDTNPIHNLKEHAPTFIRIIEKNIVVAIGWIVRNWYIDRKTRRSISIKRRKK
jgi:hypothetical protein